MIGAIAGDIIGSVYERHQIKTKDFPLFDARCCFTDDTVLTVAVADAILSGAPYIDSVRRIGRRHPAAGSLLLRRHLMPAGIFHLLRHQAIEPFNGLFKNVFEWGGQVPVKGLKRTQLIVLGAVLLFQLVLLHQFEHGQPLGQGIKPLLRAA